MEGICFGCDLITVTANKDNRRPASAPAAPSDTAKHRRIGKIVRDERDIASVEWVAAPPGYDRVPLSLEGTLPPNANGIRASATGGYNPYETMAPQKAKAAAEKRPVKRGLRRLSEWIKQMRELAGRKKRGDV